MRCVRDADLLEDRIQEFHYRYQKKMGRAMAAIETGSTGVVLGFRILSRRIAPRPSAE